MAWSGLSCKFGEALGRNWVKSKSREAAAVGKHRGQAFDLMLILVDVGTWEGHLVLRKPCCAGGAGQGWSRVPEGASTRGGVCFYLSACRAPRTSAAGVGSDGAWRCSGGTCLLPRRWGHLRRGGEGGAGSCLCSAPQLSAGPYLLAVTGITWETQVPAVGNGESETTEKIEKTRASLAQCENQVKNRPVRWLVTNTHP